MAPKSPQEMSTFKGYLASVALQPDRVDIARTFVGRMNGNRGVSIPWRSIIAVDYRDPTAARNGYVHFVVVGDPRGLSATGNGNRLATAARQPHALMFTWQQRKRYQRLLSLLGQP